MQTNTLINRATFSRYWNTKILKPIQLSYKLHTFRAYRITELISSGIDATLVARNCGLSVSQIDKTYLRFTAEDNWDKLVMKDKKEDSELRSIIASS